VNEWGTVREDYSDNGNAWDYFTHDQTAMEPRPADTAEKIGLRGLSPDHLLQFGYQLSEPLLSRSSTVCASSVIHST
jgi:hypothetical protein